MDWTRGTKVTAGQYFTSTEFECQCGKCTLQQLDDGLISILNQIRAELNNPIKVTSGFRCSEHQKDLLDGGTVQTVKKSTHELGKAVDITSKDLNTLYTICEKHVKAIGDGRSKGFIHIDMRDDKIRRWSY